MNRFTKVSLALASTGGALLFTAAPMAFASVNYDAPAVSLSAAGSYQAQNGTDSYGSTLDQNASVSAGSVSAESYYNDSYDKGFTGSQTTYNNQGGHNTSVPVSSDSTTNYGGGSWTKATDFSTQGASTSTSQSQNISSKGEGAQQFGVSGAVSGTLGFEEGITGGAALNMQRQNGDDAMGVTMAQTSSAQAGLTTADHYQYDSTSKGFTDTANTWNSGALTSTQTVKNNGSGSYTKADDYLNTLANSSQDQSQNIAANGWGGTQHQGQVALTGQVNLGW